MKKIHQNRQHKSIKLQTLSRRLAVVGLLLLGCLAFSLHMVVAKYNVLITEFNQHLSSHELINDLQNGSDKMTEQSRLFVVTGDSIHMQNYMNVVNQHLRENAEETFLIAFGGKGYDDSLSSVEEALRESDALMDYELHAMKLVSSALNLSSGVVPNKVEQYPLSADELQMSSEDKRQTASDLVFGLRYRLSKQQIDLDIQNASGLFSDEVENRIHHDMDDVSRLMVLMVGIYWALGILIIVIMVLIYLLIIKPLNNYSKCIEEDRKFEESGVAELMDLARTYNNIFEINRANKSQMNFLLEHDTLTQACSRLAFEEQKKMLTNAQFPIALLVFDVDGFKTVNDTYGHDVGDRALVRVVNTVRSILRSDDIVARIGGDEFVVVMMNIYSYSADVIGEKLDRINHILLNPQDGSPKLSISVGIAFSEYGYSEELFKQADRALYIAKANGKKTYHVYNEQDE